MRIVSVVLLLLASVLAESGGGLQWKSPAGWMPQPERPMRAATYRLPAAKGEIEGECAVYYFGPGQGGSVEANLNRWNGQVTGADGKPAEAKIAKRTVHQLPVTTIDASGNYSGMGGPTAPPKSVAANQRLLGAIIEGPNGNVFVKCTGPAKTLAARQSEFEQFLNSFEKQK